MFYVFNGKIVKITVSKNPFQNLTNFIYCKKCPPLLKGGGFNEVEDEGFLSMIYKNPLGFAVSPFIKGNKKYYK